MTKPKKKPAPKRKPVAAAKPPLPPPTERTLVLRTVDADLVARGNVDGVTWSFQWPASGPVECPDWDPAPTCGHGLHGLAWGEGDWNLLHEEQVDRVWQVVDVATADLVWIGTDKVKFPRGAVAFSGAKSLAIARVLCGPEAMARAAIEAQRWQTEHQKASLAASSGNSSKAASSGDSSKAASSGNYSKAASSGNSSKAASSGNSSTAASSGNSSKAASSGDSSKAASSGDYSKAASSGDHSTAASSGDFGIAATIGNDGRAKAGPKGLVIVTHWVDAATGYEACVGKVGRNGILADAWYRVRDGRLVPC